jgi:hypothetical protein
MPRNCKPCWRVNWERHSPEPPRGRRSRPSFPWIPPAKVRGFKSKSRRLERCWAHRSGRPRSLPRAFARASSAAENSPSSKAYRRAQTARSNPSELSSLLSAQGRSGASRTGQTIQWPSVTSQKFMGEVFWPRPLTLLPFSPSPRGHKR